MESINYNFYTDENLDEPYVCVLWHGKYTIGHTYCRGTKVWLKTNIALSLSTDFCSKQEEEEFYEGLKNDSPTDDCCIRGESLVDILRALKPIKNENYKYVQTDEKLSKLLERGSTAYCNNELYEKIKHNRGANGVLVDLYPSNKAWIIFDKDELCNELEIVYGECKKENVKYFWL